MTLSAVFPVRRRSLRALGTALTLLAAVISLGSCKDFGVPDFRLSIRVDEGVVGYPAAGTSTHRDLTTIDYKYTAINANLPADVVINGNHVLGYGKLTMYRDLDVTAHVLDLRDRWKITFTTSDTPAVVFSFYVTLRGGIDSGTFTDERGFHGTWQVVTETFKMTWTDWFDYALEGQALYEMDGTYNGQSASGTWAAERAPL